MRSRKLYGVPPGMWSATRFNEAGSVRSRKHDERRFHPPPPARFNEAGSVRSRKPSGAEEPARHRDVGFNEAGSVRSRKLDTGRPGAGSAESASMRPAL